MAIIKTLKEPDKKQFIEENGIPAGICVVDKNFPYNDGILQENKNHPFVIYDETEKIVKLTMIMTLYCEDEHGNVTTDKRENLKKYSKEKELPQCHPPLSEDDNRRRYYDCERVYIYSKEYLTKDKNLEICNDGGLFLNENTVADIKENICKYENKRREYIDYIYNGKKFNYEEIEKIIDGYNLGFTDKQIKIYANKKYSLEEMKNIKNGIKIMRDGYNISFKKMFGFSETSFSTEKLALIYGSIAKGIPPHIIRIYANPKLDLKEMQVFYDAYLNEEKEGLLKRLEKKDYGADVLFIKNAYKRFGSLIEEDIKRFKDMLPQKSFNEEQIKQIIIGIKHNIKYYIYAEPRFDAETMEQIRLGIEKGLKVKEMSLYISKNLNRDQKIQIRLGLQNLTTEQVKAYLRTDLKAEKMEQIRLGFEAGLSEDEISLYSDESIGFSSEQMEQIRIGLEEHFSEDEIMLYYNENLTAEQMKQIRICIEQGMSEEETFWFLDKELSPEQMECIKEGKDEGLTQEQIELCADNNFSIEQMSLIINFFGRQGSKHTIEQGSVFAKPEFKPEQMKQIIYDYYRGLSVEQVSVYANPKFSARQMSQIGTAMINGATKEEIDSLLDENLEPEQMYARRMIFEKQTL